MFRFSLLCLILISHVYAASDVSKQLRECEQHFKANRLTSGDGGTALECYQKVLKIEATNAEALAGMEKIEARYVKWTKRALEKVTHNCNRLQVSHQNHLVNRLLPPRQNPNHLLMKSCPSLQGRHR